MKPNKKLKKKRIIIFLSIIIAIIMISSFFNLKKDEGEVDKAEIAKQQADEEEKEKVITKLENMNERSRMEYYLSIFINYIENYDYESAYNLLYDEFKQNYFPTLNDFEKYAKETFPQMMNIEHYNIERNGDVYVLWIYISDIINGGPNDKKEMNVVIKENDFNDFVMSFSVI